MNILRLFKNNDKVDITLEQLSSLWLPEKKPVVPLPIKTNKWECPVLNCFYRDYIENYITQKAPHYTKIVDEVFKLFDNPSHNTIKDHTLTVTEKTVEMIQKGVTSPNLFIPEAIVAALTHDIGQIYNKDKNADHIINSLLFLENHIAEIEGSAIITAVRLHHEKKSALPGADPIVFSLNQIERQLTKKTVTPTINKEPEDTPPNKPEEKPELSDISVEKIIETIIHNIDPTGIDTFYYQDQESIFVKATQLKKLFTPGEIKTIELKYNTKPNFVRLRLLDKKHKPKKIKYYIFKVPTGIPKEKMGTPLGLRAIDVIQGESS